MLDSAAGEALAILPSCTVMPWRRVELLLLGGRSGLRTTLAGVACLASPLADTASAFAPTMGDGGAGGLVRGEARARLA